ncbi:MAG: hypothetical protein ACRDF8_00475 [Chloroflexota bacterium]
MNISATLAQEPEQRSQGGASDDEYLTANEAAGVLKISTSSIWR